MTTLSWVKKHMDFALKAENNEELILRLQAIITRLNISPLEDSPEVVKLAEGVLK